VTRLVRLPGVYAPRSDTDLLLGAVTEAVRPGLQLLDLCTGTGALAVAAARAGCHVLAVDVSRRAVLNVRINAWLNRVRVRAVAGDLWEPAGDRRFDLIVANPPYLPGSAAPQGEDRAWDAGPDGRALLDRICAGAADHLRPSGRLLLMQSSLADVGLSERGLETTGLRTRVVAQREGPLGPLAAERSDLHGEDRETLVVLEGLAPGPGVGVGDEVGDGRGERPARDVGERHLL
jgi:release factor glutamine methyltransferase